MQEVDFPFRPDLEERLWEALEEDIGLGDMTSLHTIPAQTLGRGVIKAKEEGIICGLPIAKRVFALSDPRLTLTMLVEDGTRVHRGLAVMRIEGSLRSILAGERLALNFLQRLSGMATLTRVYADAIPAGSNLAVYDTRKTTPLWRDVNRYAVRVGGGRNHRWGLYDMVMIKDTHADACGGLANALERVRAANQSLPIAAEARTLAEARAAAAAGVNLLMLDNMDDDTIGQVVRELGGKCEIEVTGGIRPDRLPYLAALGVNRVSVGALTHSSRALDLSLTLESP